MGNRNWMRAREALLASDVIPGDLDRLFPICTPGASDSASFDEVLELLHMGGRSLPHSVLMMIPEAWENHTEMDDARRAFYEFHSALMEPWDGPACVVFTDGSQIGAVLDRNGLRPSRYWVTDDGLVVLASEVGVLDLDPASIVRKGRLQPGPDVPRRHRRAPHHRGRGGQGRARGRAPLRRVAARRPGPARGRPRARAHRAHPRVGHPAPADLRLHRGGAARPAHPDGQRRRRAASARWAPTRRSPRSRRSRGCSSTTSASSSPRSPTRRSTRSAKSSSPRSTARSVRRPTCSTRGRRRAARSCCRSRSSPTTTSPRSATSTATATCPASPPTSPAASTPSRAAARRWPPGSTRSAPRSPRRSPTVRASSCSPTGTPPQELAPIPSLLLTGAVHHHLVREKTRTQVGLLVEAGDVREVHHVALLIGYGAAAVNPYLAMESVEDLARDGFYVKVEPEVAVKNLIKALGKGVLKVMSKMGVSTVASYTGAQIFETVGLSSAVVDRYFTGTTSKLGGVGLDVVAEEVARRHATAYPRGGISPSHRELQIGGEYQWRREGEPHLFDPDTVFRLQHSTRTQRYDIFKQYTSRVDEQAERLMTLRGLFRFRDAADTGRAADPDRGGRADLRDRQAVLDRRDVLRLDLAGGARDAGHRDEPAGREVQHRRGRRGRRPPARPRAALVGQAGGLGPVRRDLGVPHQRRRHPDQDGPGREARRGRPAARQQGLPVGRQDPALDAGRRADQPAAAPRHLLDRGPRAADPRPQERQPVGAGARQARLRGRRRHRGRRASPRRTPTSS